MDSYLVAVMVIVAGGVLALLAGRRATAAGFCALSSLAIGDTVCLVRAVAVLAQGSVFSLKIPWSISVGPLAMGSLSLAIDSLSAVFVVLIAVVTLLAAVYGVGYLKKYSEHKSLGSTWFFFNLLATSMLVVVVARNGLLFLMAWELMSLASFFLVMFEAEEASVRRAGWIYLAAMHMGTAFLVAMFLVLGRGSDSLDFSRFAVAPGMSGVIFLLAVVGFGTKAGLVPMHVWLPEAHPAAPSHVSAVMSGVMIKTGIYGLLRILTLLGPPLPWWGWTLLGLGVLSGILGVLNALAQHDLKRLLAYSSVENVGIIAIGLGVGMLGVSYNIPAMAVLGFTGGLLHTINHALFKGLLFLGAGSVVHATGTRAVNRLGGLLARMPVTGAAFLVGAAAISGLPPLNGFLGELLIYLAALAGITTKAAAADVPLVGLIAVGGLALIGGLAAVCFTSTYGVVFLGMPRSQEAGEAHEAPLTMRAPLVILALLCVVAGLAAPAWPLVLRHTVAMLVPEKLWTGLVNTYVYDLLRAVRLVSCFLLALIVVLILVRRRLLAGRRVQRDATWGCGYLAPTPRMQYTAAAFVRPVTTLFRRLLLPNEEIRTPQGLFPVEASVKTETPDLCRTRIFAPLFAAIAWIASKCRWLQQGRIQIYVLYIALTLLILLIWKLG